MAKNDKYLIPDLIPYDNELIYKTLAKEFGLTKKEISYIVRTNFWFFRKFVNEHVIKDQNINFPNLGRFRVYKTEYSEERKLIKDKIYVLISTYINHHLEDEEVDLLRKWSEEGYWIPYKKDILELGKRTMIPPVIPPPPPEPMKPEDSVMEKFKDEEFGDSDFDVF